MILEKDGIRVNPQHPSDIAKLKALGYQPVVEPLPEPVAKPAPVAAGTPEQANADAIKEVNALPKPKEKG